VGAHSLRARSIAAAT